jgi:hypothetical protein
MFVCKPVVTNYGGRYSLLTTNEFRLQSGYPNQMIVAHGCICLYCIHTLISFEQFFSLTVADIALFAGCQNIASCVVKLLYLLFTRDADRCHFFCYAVMLLYSSTLAVDFLLAKLEKKVLNPVKEVVQANF